MILELSKLLLIFLDPKSNISLSFNVKNYQEDHKQQKHENCDPKEKVVKCEGFFFKLSRKNYG